MEFLMTIQPIAERLFVVFCIILAIGLFSIPFIFMFFDHDEEGRGRAVRSIFRILISTFVCLILVSIPASAKEMFKNRIVYGAVTSDTTAHAVQTLDKLLDTIDKKLDDMQNVVE
jgi:uncharacterized PurR-regulated membrane protein YhhQ (DUF165 family)